MEEDDDGLLLNFVTTPAGNVTGKRKSSKDRYIEQHGKAAKKRRAHHVGVKEGGGVQAAGTLGPTSGAAKKQRDAVRGQGNLQKDSSLAEKKRVEPSTNGQNVLVKVDAKTASAGKLGGFSVSSGGARKEANGAGGRLSCRSGGLKAEKKAATVSAHATNAAADTMLQHLETKPLSAEVSKALFSASTFGELGLCAPVAQHIEGGLGFAAPTHVQKEAIPVMLTGQDCLVKADTGSGKTLAYLAPIVDQLARRDKKVERQEGTYALVLAPTRELCLQIYGVAEKLVKRFIWLVPGQIMGGEKKAKEKARLRKGVTILVATPGRLLDHLKSTSSFRLDHLQWLIFDEADRLLDLGFEKDIVQILEILDDPSRKGATCRMRRQIALFSATLNARVDRLANLSLSSPIKVGLESANPSSTAIADPSSKPATTARDDDFDLDQELRGKDAEQFRIPSQLRQFYLKVPWKLRLIALATFLRARMAASAKRCKMVVFFSTCDAVEFHHLLFTSFSLTEENSSSKEGNGRPPTYVSCPVFKLHGNLSQQERLQTFFAFGKVASGVLLCTDVAARGLDIPAVNAIVQYDTPGEAEEYVHRVGRTARLGREGESFLFLQPNEVDYLDLLRKRHVTLEPLPLMDILEDIPLDRRKGQIKEVLIPEIHPGVLALEKRLEAALGRQRELRQLAVDAFRSFLRSYAAHRGSLKQIFHVKRLHLGHVARSFALREAPSLLGQSSKKLAMKKEKQERLKQFTRKKKRVTAATMGE